MSRKDRLLRHRLHIEVMCARWQVGRCLGAMLGSLVDWLIGFVDWLGEDVGMIMS